MVSVLKCAEIRRVCVSDTLQQSEAKAYTRGPLWFFFPPHIWGLADVWVFLGVYFLFSPNCVYTLGSFSIPKKATFLGFHKKRLYERLGAKRRTEANSNPSTPLIDEMVGYLTTHADWFTKQISPTTFPKKNMTFAYPFSPPPFSRIRPEQNRLATRVAHLDETPLRHLQQPRRAHQQLLKLNLVAHGYVVVAACVRGRSAVPAHAALYAHGRGRRRPKYGAVSVAEITGRWWWWRRRVCGFGGGGGSFVAVEIRDVALGEPVSEDADDAVVDADDALEEAFVRSYFYEGGRRAELGEAFAAVEVDVLGHAG